MKHVGEVPVQRGRFECTHVGRFERTHGPPSSLSLTPTHTDTHTTTHSHTQQHSTAQHTTQKQGEKKKRDRDEEM